MATRATYKFGTTTLYIHYDGYPKGAAAYFFNALTHPNQEGDGAEQMLRANDRAEVTTSHQDHGDTQYRYDVTGWGPSAIVTVHNLVRPFTPAQCRKWVLIHHMPLYEFVDMYLKGVDGYEPEKLGLKALSDSKQVTP